MWLFCAVGVESRLWAPDLFASFIISLFWGNMVSLFFSQCRPRRYLSALFAEASFAHSELLNTNGQSLFPLCSTCHLMCHFDWQRNRGPICKGWLPEHPVWKDIHQNLHALFLASLSYYLYSAVRGTVELITLYFWGLREKITWLR